MANRKSKPMRIKPSIPKSDKSESELQEMMNELRRGIDSIYRYEKYLVKFEDLYKHTTVLINHKKGNELYTMIEELIKVYVSSIFSKAPLLSDYLSGLFGKWIDFKRCTNSVDQIMLYVNNNYVPQNHKLKIYSIGLKHMKNLLLNSDYLGPSLTQTLTDEVVKDRNSEYMDKEQLKTILQMLIEVGEGDNSLYREAFEQSFLELTRTTYKEEAAELIQDSSSPDYLKHVEKRLREEQGRVQDYLDISSESSLLDVVDDCFLLKYSRSIISTPGSGLDVMIVNKQEEDLSRFYRLFNRNPSLLNELLAALSLYIERTGAEIIDAPDNRRDPIKLVREILPFNKEFKTLLERAFNKDRKVEVVIKSSFENFINKSNRVAVALAIFFDNLLIKEAKNMSEPEKETEIEDIFSLFRYLAEKDVFENYHRLYLSKRLMTDKSKDSDLEELFIKKLKNECGTQYISKMNGMLNDLKISQESTEQFENPGISVKVLTEAFWPSDKSPQFAIPRELTDLSDSFRDFYSNANPSRRLTWRLSYGNIILSAILGKMSKKHELQVSVIQASILLEFNHRSEQSVQEICEKLQTPEDIQSHIIYLVKNKVLSKSPAEKVIHNSDVLTVNTSAVHKYFKLNLVPSFKLAGSSTKISEKIPETVLQERNHIIDAAVVKVMKVRNSLVHQALIAEVLRLVTQRFKPDVKQIKSRIDSLINREFIKRDDQETELYHYLA